MDLKTECSWVVENFRTNLKNRSEIVCLLHRLEEGIWPYKVDHINADTKRKWNRLARKKIDQQIVHGSEC